jgi:hypothetical protein
MSAIESAERAPRSSEAPSGATSELFGISEIRACLQSLQNNASSTNRDGFNLMRQLCQFDSPTQPIITGTFMEINDPFAIQPKAGLEIASPKGPRELFEAEATAQDDPQKKLEDGLSKFERGKYRESAPIFSDLVKFVRDKLPDGPDKDGKLCALLYYSALAKSRPDATDADPQGRKGGSLEAIPDFKEAVDLAKKLKLPSEKLADIQREQAGNLLALGPSHAKDARAVLEEAVKTLDAADDKPNPMMKGMILADLGQAKVTLADQSKDEKERKDLYSGAEKDLRSSYDIITKTIKAETDPEKQSLQEVALMLTLAKLVDVLKKQGKGDDDKEVMQYGLQLLELEKKHPLK